MLLLYLHCSTKIYVTVSYATVACLSVAHRQFSGTCRCGDSCFITQKATPSFLIFCADINTLIKAHAELWGWNVAVYCLKNWI